jgi:hypothetical protein
MKLCSIVAKNLNPIDSVNKSKIDRESKIFRAGSYHDSPSLWWLARQTGGTSEYEHT